MPHAIALPLAVPRRLALAVPIAIALAIAFSHVASEPSPETAPETPGCVGCHHTDPAPAPDAGLADPARRAIAEFVR